VKILAIRGANLASLAGEFEIDLVNGPLGTAGVFAIVGPTGAGKSTLLDAMCVALFDRTPRLTNHSRVVVGRGDDDPTALGAQDVRSLLRRGASAGYAEVDFESGDLRRYRARWSVRRARNATDGRFQSQQVTLASLDRGGHVVEQLGGTKTETLDAIHERLGLTFDQFRRSALLAQGDFAAFLRADGKDRSELLERMTGTEIYTRLSVAAHHRASLAEQQLRDRHGAALAIAVLSDDERARAESDLVLAKDAQSASRVRLAAAETAARWIAEAVQRERALAEAEAGQRAATAAVEGAAAERAELALRRRAEALRGTWEETARLDRQLSVARGEAANAEQAASRAETEQREIDELHERLVELHAPIRDARIAAGLVERAAAGAGRFGTRAKSASQRGAQVDDARARSPSQGGTASSDARALSSSPGGSTSSDARARSSSHGESAYADDARITTDDAAPRFSGLARGSAASIAPPKDIEARAKAAVADADWLLARRELGPLAATWTELDARLAQQASLAAEIGAIDKLLSDRARHREQLAAQRKAAAAEHQTAVARLTEAQAEAASFEKKRGLTLDAARRAEDEARRRCADVERLVVIASEARAAANARTEFDRQLAELVIQAATDAEQSRAATTERDAAATLRTERQRMVDELRKAAGYIHARAELVDGDPCPLCGAEEHPWHGRGAFDALIVDAQERLAEAVSRADAALATLATLAAREAHRAKEKTRLAAVRATTETTIAATSRTWREQLASLGELLLVDDPTSDAAAQLAIERTEAAHAKLESARGARSQAEAVAKAATEAQARVQARHADVEHHVHALRNADGAIASIDAAVERLRGERAGKLERHGELVDTIEAAFTRWFGALPPEDAARAVVELALDALSRGTGGAVADDVRAGKLGVHAAASVGADVGAREVRIDAHVGADTRVRSAKRASAKGTGVHASAATSGDSGDETHVGTDATHGTDAGPDNVSAGTSRTHVGTAVADRGLDAHVGALLDRCRRALADTASAWMRHADIVAALDAELGAALATIEQAAREAERVFTDAIARRDTTAARRDGANAELTDAAARLETARIAAGFDADELRRLLTEPPTRVELLAQRLDALERAADRARTLVIERSRHLDEHRAASPLAADASGSLTADASHVEELAAAVSTADHHAAALAATLAADLDAHTRRAAALAQHAAAEQAAEIDRVLGQVIGSHDGKLFRSFAQSLTLDGLLAVANSHLEELAPRYQLERVPKHDLELQVIDRDLGNEIRGVQSLSGGESFLVSLALALGLSSMSAHDVRVRTLLIDEGFGTLDPATLDSALAVLDALQATGRQVGVISHVPALVERVGAHVRVHPRGGGKSEVIVAEA
jgi:exonuclease SbcC